MMLAFDVCVLYLLVYVFVYVMYVYIKYVILMVNMFISTLFSSRSSKRNLVNCVPFPIYQNGHMIYHYYVLSLDELYLCIT